ncbi:MAG: phage tail protein [Candidatus Pristimantibacillus sp.]
MSFIVIDAKELRDSLKEMKNINKRMPSAINSSLIRSAQAIRTAAARKVREIYFVKHGEVIKKIQVKKFGDGRMGMILESKDRAIRLINFKVNPKGKTTKLPKVLKAGVKRQGGAKKIPHAFIATVRGGHTGVFQRVAHSKHRKNDKGIWSEGPIDQIRGPAIPVMLSQEGIVKHVQDVAVEVIIKRLDHEIRRQVLKGG